MCLSACGSPQLRIGNRAHRRPALTPGFAWRRRRRRRRGGRVSVCQPRFDVSVKSSLYINNGQPYGSLSNVVEGRGRSSLVLSRLNLTFHSRISRRSTSALFRASLDPSCAPSQEQDVLQDDLWRVQASDLVWVRSTRCVGTQRHPRGESVPHVEDRSGLAQASRGGDLDTYRSAG